MSMNSIVSIGFWSFRWDKPIIFQRCTDPVNYQNFPGWLVYTFENKIRFTTLGLLGIPSPALKFSNMQTWIVLRDFFKKGLESFFITKGKLKPFYFLTLKPCICSNAMQIGLLCMENFEVMFRDERGFCMYKILSQVF